MRFKRLPKAVREAGISMIERKLATGTVTDLVTISDRDWHQACRRAVDARLRDRGLEGLTQQRVAARSDPAITLTPRTRQALAIVQIDHTLVDIMVVDEVLRQSMGRPWITVLGPDRAWQILKRGARHDDEPAECPVPQQLFAPLRYG